MAKTPDDYLSRITQYRTVILAEIHSEIGKKQGFAEAFQILRTHKPKQREYIEDQIVKFVAQYRNDERVDEIELLSRGSRINNFVKMSIAAKTLVSIISKLEPADQLNLGIAGEPELNKMLQDLDNVEIDFLELLQSLANAASEAGNTLPKRAGGAYKKMARYHMACLCLRLYAEFRKDGRSPGATKNGYMDFLSLVYQLASDDEASLDRPADEAYGEFKKKTGFFKNRVKDKT